MFKFIGRHWQKRRERFYLKNRWHLILDFSLGIIIILLATAVISLHFYRPSFSWPFGQSVPEKTVIDLNNPPLILNFSLASSSLRLTNGLEIKVNLENSSKLLMQDIKVNLVTIDKVFVIKKIEVINDAPAVAVNNRQISLGSLGAYEKKEVGLRVYFESKDEAKRVIVWQAQNSYLAQGQEIKETNNLPNINLASELNAKALIYYNSPQGDQLGSGPLPPLVGLPTNYWAFFEVKVDGDFKNLVFSAKLPKGVELTDRRSLLSGDFKYNAASRQIVWTVAELKNQSDSYRVGFEIQFTPKASQLDKVTPLLTNIRYYAHDSLTNEESSAELGELDTNLDFDRLNKGQGKISQP